MKLLQVSIAFVISIYVEQALSQEIVSDGESETTFTSAYQAPIDQYFSNLATIEACSLQLNSEFDVSGLARELTVAHGVLWGTVIAVEQDENGIVLTLRAISAWKIANETLAIRTGAYTTDLLGMEVFVPYVLYQPGNVATSTLVDAGVYRVVDDWARLGSYDVDLVALALQEVY